MEEHEIRHLVEQANKLFKQINQAVDVLAAIGYDLPSMNRGDNSLITEAADSIVDLASDMLGIIERNAEAALDMLEDDEGMTSWER